MSREPSRLLKRGFIAASVALLSAVAVQSCGFPDHDFIDDDAFNSRGAGKAGKTGAGGHASPDASMTGSGGNTNPGGGAAGATGGDQGIAGTTGKGDGGASGVDSGAGGKPDVPDASVDGSTDSSTGPVCDVGLSACGSTCVDLLTDRTHCGNCDTLCTGTDVCTKDGCAAPCDQGLTECKAVGSSTSVCVDTTQDENNCNGCNKPCPSGFVCEASKCVVDCGTQSRCGTACVDLQSDDTHCGDCGKNCKTTGLVCSGGNCQASCTPPFIACGSTCVNPNNDGQNCNGCNKPCATGEGCIGAKCTKLVEDCTNGSDDDDDSLIDCADPDCNTGFKCAATPAGWTGPIALWTGTAGTGPSSCNAAGGKYPIALLNANDGLVTPGYTCPACNCTISGGGACDTLKLVFDTSSDCSNVNPWKAVPAAATNSCINDALDLCCARPNVPSEGQAHSVMLESPGTSYAHGSCLPSQATPSFPATSWSTDVLGCAPPQGNGGGCGGGQCLPKPAAPFGTSLCVFRSGISTCPTDYPAQRPGASKQFYQSVDDHRSCSTCSCGSPYCGGTFSLSTDANCTANKVVLNLGPGNSCNTIPADTSQDVTKDRFGTVTAASDTRSYTYTGASSVCGSAASAFANSIAPSGPITVCCQP